MRDYISPEQAMALASALLSNVNFEGLQPNHLQQIIDSPKKAGEALTLLLQNGARLPNPGVYIDRSQPVDFGRYGNPITTNALRLVDEEPRAHRINFLTLADIKLIDLRNKGELYISGEEAVRRARAKLGHIPLDYTAGFEVFRHLRHVFPLAWRGFRIFIDGTTVSQLTRFQARRYSVAMYYRNGWQIELDELSVDSDVRPRRKNWVTLMIKSKKS